MKRKSRLLAASAVLLLGTLPASATLSITTTGAASVITFDSTLAGISNGQFTGAGFQSTPSAGQLDSDAWAVTGWSNGNLAFGGTQTTANTDYTRGAVTTAQTTGGIYAHGTTNRQLLIQPGGSDWAPGTMTLRVANNTGMSINTWVISYDLFVRNDQARSNSFNFSYSTDGSTFITTGLADALFTYTSPAAAGVTSLASVGSPSATISPTVANGGNLFFRWSGADVGGSGSRDEFALDNISITAVPEPSAALLGGLGLLALLRRRR
jgi:hypothetical protein